MIIETKEQEQKLTEEYCGSDYFALDEKHMNALINGKKIGLVVLDEYTIFIEKKKPENFSIEQKKETKENIDYSKYF